MTHHFNVTGAERKKLAQLIGEAIGQKPVYQYMPTCAYQIGRFNLSKDGALSWADMDDADPELLEESCNLIAALQTAGYHSDESAFYEAQLAARGEITEEPLDRSTEVEENSALCIQLPADSLNDGELELLKLLVDGKATLIKKATGASRLNIFKTNDAICFPWFDTLPQPDMIEAVSTLITQLIKTARGMKRVTATDHEVDNEKYAFRCFLLRLGFIGDSFKKERATLLKNLTGSAAFKNSVTAGKEAQ